MERGCGVLDQPQEVEMPGALCICLRALYCVAAAAGLRHSRAPSESLSVERQFQSHPRLEVADESLRHWPPRASGTAV
jgi:hypothetical protein